MEYQHLLQAEIMKLLQESRLAGRALNIECLTREKNLSQAADALQMLW